MNKYHVLLEVDYAASCQRKESSSPAFQKLPLAVLLIELALNERFVLQELFHFLRIGAHVARPLRVDDRVRRVLVDRNPAITAVSASTLMLK